MSLKSSGIFENSSPKNSLMSSIRYVVPNPIIPSTSASPYTCIGTLLDSSSRLSLYSFITNFPG